MPIPHFILIRRIITIIVARFAIIASVIHFPEIKGGARAQICHVVKDGGRV
jgi:hypothetical protein